MNSSSQEALLLVEDDDVDAMALEQTLNKIRPSLKLIRPENGKEALEMPEIAKPDLIVMDIRMPKMDGREALALIKQDEILRKIRVIMMSTSSNNEDIDYCYSNDSNAYLIKPLGPEESMDIMNKVIDFWFGALAR